MDEYNYSKTWRPQCLYWLSSFALYWLPLAPADPSGDSRGCDRVEDLGSCFGRTTGGSNLASVVFPLYVPEIVTKWSFSPCDQPTPFHSSERIHLDDSGHE